MVSEFCWRILGDFERFLLLLGEFSFCLLVGSFFEGRIHQRTFLGEISVDEKFQSSTGQSDFKRCSVQVGLVACFCPPPP